MSNIDKQVLRQTAEKAQEHGVFNMDIHSETLLALLDEVEELQSFRTAYMEWSDKTDWVRTDRRFDVVKPLGKHLADVLKEYIEHLESRTVTVWMPKLYQTSCSEAEKYLEPIDVEQAILSAGADAGLKIDIEWEAE